MMLLSFPTTVAVSDIILGNRPTVGRSFHCVFSKRVGSLFITYLFLLFITSVGLLMLIVPGILFTIWYMLTLQVALLEHLSGWKAMDRSKELGKEFYLRNLGVIFLTYIIIFSFSFVVGIALYTVFPNYELIQGTKFFEEFFIQTLGAILSPLPLIAPVLIYYDMRARKEAYDIRTLTEDLARE